MQVMSLSLLPLSSLLWVVPVRAPNDFCSPAFPEQMASSSPALWEFLTCFYLLTHLALIFTDMVSSYSGRSPLLLSLKCCSRGFGPQSIPGSTTMSPVETRWMHRDGFSKIKADKSPASLNMGLPTSFPMRRSCQTKSLKDQ